MSGNKSVHLIEGQRVHIDFRMLRTDQLVRPVAGLTGFAVQQRIGKARHMARGDPGLGVHENRRVQAHIVRAFLNEFLQPRFFHIVLELHPQRAVVPAVGKTPVDLAARVNKAAVFAQVDDHIQGLFAVFHIPETSKRSIFQKALI